MARKARIRGNELLDLNIKAVVHRSDNSVVAVSLVNMCFEGCEMTAARSFDVGERVRIQLDGQGFIEAEVRWSSEGRIGAEFMCECLV